MNLQQSLEQECQFDDALEASMSSVVEEEPPWARFSLSASSSELSSMPYDSFLMETNGHSSFSDLDSSLLQYDSEDTEKDAFLKIQFYESPESSSLISYPIAKDSDDGSDEHGKQESKRSLRDRQEMISKGQRGRPYKFNETAVSLEMSKYIPASYRKGIERAYKTQNPSRWCHICNRSSSRAYLMPCFNRWYHRCRKSICQFCIHRYYLRQPSVPPCMLARNKFFCSHCLGICPANSQCRTYQKTNIRRHIRSLLDKQQE
ncbi:hypothetical protein GpartN1_g5761.t1 [Galdieria partita]|uniref:Zinc-finger domain-containing protein n=1 Tax=Galdieria partita TaxID=83374 RepID=A0A9C7Q0R9_9RHOD|nr:hypothetical protein GpartN1_g5761.t1 [Galdieria partita]